ncbi:MAG TPA: cytochrome c3 family protein [Kofleriaceae bacterium]|nr:cytochrome c3 family protein [Kofleriaceae bacterium]
MRITRWLLVLAACGAPGAPAREPAPSPGLASNVLRADYAGSPACSDCHGQVYSAWAASPMRNMTRDAKTAAIRAPFDGATLHVGSDTSTAETENGERYITLHSPAGDKRFRVTKVVGGRYREDFVGVDTAGGATEFVLPMTYVFAAKSWRYKGYSVMVKERPRMAWNGEWAKECIGCHNTLPLVTMLYDELYGPTLPPYQGKMQDRILPHDKTWSAHALDERGLAHALDDEIGFLGGQPPGDDGLRATLAAAATTMEKRLDGDKLVELGIGCEACHNGSRAHAAKPEVLPAFEAKSSLVGLEPPRGETGTRAQWINHTCAKCHTVLFSRYPWTWEGGERRARDPGGSSISSGEGRDYQLGGCASQMACTACHDPHTEDSPAKLAQLATTAGDALCQKCHAGHGAEHTHHQTVGCIACHMAKKNMGLDYVLNRYHRIGSPTDANRVERDRPLECALCHVDKSVESLLTTMETWWSKHYDRAAVQRLYGADLAVNAIRATLERGKPHEQAVAIVTLADFNQRDAIAALVPMLWHEYPLVRYFAKRALQRITGDAVDIDVGAPADEVHAAAQRWLVLFTAVSAHP